MPECTKEERALLDALAEKKDIAAARFALALSTVPPELINSYVTARVRMIQASAHFTKLSDELWAIFGTKDYGKPGSLLHYPEGEKLYDELEEKAQEMAKR